MELKNYQQNVLSDLESYIKAIDQTNNLTEGWEKYWEEKDIHIGLGGVPAYQNRIHGTPHVCMKVPTGGGKTFMACCAVKTICSHFSPEMPKVVVWLVPSDSILTQTIRTLSDVNHPYRQRLDRDFAGRVGVYTKDMLLNGTNFSPDTVREMLTICVMSYASLRIDSKKKDVRKVYQENGNLFRFADYFENRSMLLADTPETALIQVIRYLSPITIVDESHNAKSELSTEMLQNLNPSFILELTATPRDSSNIISYVDARDLKKENMVKLPVIVFNRRDRQTVIQDAIQLRGNIEKAALLEGNAADEYIRPIVLFQAQPKTSKDSETFEKIKSKLIEIGIPQEQIAVKTSDIDDIGNTDLMSQDCPIRYIITVNALKEGWDCPFAYILASLANKTSEVDVEQILGRILRQPYTRKHSASVLNISYVLTSSNDFHATLENIVKGLNQSGFSKKEYRVVNDNPDQENKTAGVQQPDLMQFAQDHSQPADDEDSFSDINSQEIGNVISIHTSCNENNNVPQSNVEAMIKSATEQSEKYDLEMNSLPNDGVIHGELGRMLTQNTIQKEYQEEIKDLRLPQFVIECAPDLFNNSYELLEPENLSEGFSLTNQNAEVSFELSPEEIYSVDIQDKGEAVPKYRMVSASDSIYIKKYLESLPPEGRIQQCARLIADQINKNNRYATSDVVNYVNRVISNMTNDDLTNMETSIPAYAAKIQKKIDSLEEAYRRELFFRWIDSGKIRCQNLYKFDKVITPSSTINTIPNSLYEAEKNDMNNFERLVIDTVVSTDNIRWWHRNIERKGFRLNGYFNHYPDFIVMTKSEKIILIEAKGDYLDGDDSKEKLKLGRKWQEEAGPKYRYFMVYNDKELGLDGAYTLERFKQIMKEI